MILIAENDETTRFVLAEALARAGHTVECVEDGEALWPRLAAPDVELLVVDLRMPGMNGWEVLRRLRRPHAPESPSRVPVVVVSAQSDPETAAFTTRLGASAFLAKPLDLHELTRTVERILAAQTFSP